MSLPPKPMPPPPPKPAGKPAMPKPAAPKPQVRASKTFEIIENSGQGEGEKVVIYAGSGMGKTTLASMAPAPVFLPLDDGSRKIRDPRTGAILKAVAGIESYHDLRDALHQPNLFHDVESVVLDTITVAEMLSDPYIFENYKKENGEKVSGSIENYGYGKGYRHALEVMRLLLSDFDGLVKKGKNTILLAQENAVAIANAEGLDFLQAGPKLHHNKQVSSRLEVQEWADHVLRIGYSETAVYSRDPKATKGKISSTDTTRVIHTQGARHFFAKSRTIREPLISFNVDENGVPNDDALWQFMFPGKETPQ